MGQHELHLILKQVQTIAREAGAILREAYDKPGHIDYKGKVNLVTRADLASEEYIVNALRTAFPGYAQLAEESGETQGNNEYTWYIDPLDGTTNFAHGYPVFCVSVALSDKQAPLLGVVYDPLRDECFSAVRDHGADLNGSPLRVSAIPELSRALLATGFPYDRHDASDNNSVAHATFLRLAQGVRRGGSAALDLSYVACGRLDGYWEMRLNPWDVSVGLLLVREAGGRVTDYCGTDSSVFLYQGRHVVASNGVIHQTILSTLAELYEFAGDGMPILRTS